VCCWCWRQLCLLLNAEDVYCCCSEILIAENDITFASHMIQTLSTILLTSSELFELRTQLKELSTQVTHPRLCGRGRISWLHQVCTDLIIPASGTLNFAFYRTSWQAVATVSGLCATYYGWPLWASNQARIRLLSVFAYLCGLDLASKPMLGLSTRFCVSASLMPLIRLANFLHFTDPGGIEGWVGSVGWLRMDALPTYWLG